MKIFRSIKSNYQTQGFGESRACIKVGKNGFFIRPFVVRGKTGLTCPVGYEDFYHAMGMKGHNGIDRACWHGEPCYFNVDADTKWWSRSYVGSGGGLGIDIFSSERVYIKELPKHTGRMARKEWEENDHKLFVKFRYHHLLRSEKGDAVREPKDLNNDGFYNKVPNTKFGDLIALCDNTGASSGTHLHTSMKFVAKNSMTLDNDNGFLGSVDYEDFYENKYVLNVLHVKEQALSAINLARVFILKVQQFVISLK